MKTKLIVATLGLGLLIGIVIAYIFTRHSSSDTQPRPSNTSVNLRPSETAVTTANTVPVPVGDLLTRLSTVDVPSMCQHSAGTLVDGELRSIPSDEGFVALLVKASPDQAGATVATGDLNNDGSPDVAAGFACSRGGVSWPNWVVFYNDQMKLLASVDLGDVTPASRASLENVQIVNQVAILKWTTYEGADFCLKKWTAKVRIDNGTAKVEGLEQIGPTGAGC